MNALSYRGYRFPPVIIQHAVWLYLRFTLSFRDVRELLAERGITVSHETIRRWVAHFGPIYARRLRAERPSPTARWHLDEVFVSIAGRQMYLWRAVDDEGEVLVQAKRDKNAALRLMRKLLKNQGLVPTSIVTDRYRAHDAALRNLGLSGIHLRGKRLNNRAESSHVAVRRRERKMQGFRSAGSTQRFLSSHSATYNTFNVCRHLTTNVCRHLTTANTHRILRGQAFDAWKTAVAVPA
jgi:transposase-like protein